MENNNLKGKNTIIDKYNEYNKYEHNYINNEMLLETLPTININKEDLYTKYKEIGSGDEAFVFNYNNKKAVKIFKDYPKWMTDEVIKRKYIKVFIYSRFNDKSFCFPEGLVKVDNKNSGYYMKYVNTDKNLNHLIDLRELRNFKKIEEYLIKSSEAIERIHDEGFIIGDIRPSNILIDKRSNVKFVDTDSYAYKNFDFDIRPVRANTLKNIYGVDNDKDNDIFVFTLLALKYLTGKQISTIKPDMEYVLKLLDCLNLTNEVKEILESILSDSANKPQPSHALKLIKPESITI